MRDVEAEIAAFYAEHAAGGSGNVVVVIADRKDGSLGRIGIFSTLAKAQAWANSLGNEDYLPRVIGPYVVDAPEFGNVPDEDLH